MFSSLILNAREEIFIIDNKLQISIGKLRKN